MKDNEKQSCPPVFILILNHREIWKQMRIPLCIESPPAVEGVLAAAVACRRPWSCSVGRVMSQPASWPVVKERVQLEGEFAVPVSQQRSDLLRCAAQKPHEAAQARSRVHARRAGAAADQRQEGLELVHDEAELAGARGCHLQARRGSSGLALSGERSATRAPCA